MRIILDFFKYFIKISGFFIIWSLVLGTISFLFCLFLEYVFGIAMTNTVINISLLFSFIFILSAVFAWDNNH